ncbi:MAG TPA: energy transducer TonB [Terriglobia bacterium]|nr:energy transducer TonB [Terriglobia bacterium]
MDQKDTGSPAVFSTGASVSDQPSWLISLLRQIRESYDDYRHPRIPAPVTAAPDPGGAQVLIEGPSVLGSTIASVRTFIEDWRRPRCEGAGRVEVAALWADRSYRTQVFTFAGYAATVVMLFAAPHGLRSVLSPDTVIAVQEKAADSPLILPDSLRASRKEVTAVATGNGQGGAEPRRRSADVPAPATSAETPGGGGGGGKHELTESSRDPLPTFAPIQLSVPSVVALNADPEIAVPPTIVAANASPFRLDLPNQKIGNPLGTIDGPPSSGKGGGGGIGEGNGTGVGPGDGRGFGPGCCEGTGGGRGNSIPPEVGRSGPGGPGGPGGGPIRIPGGSVSAPVPLIRPNPAYSEDARKNKISGSVLLEVVVRADGSVGDIRMVRGLGHGLDESSITTVKTWKFRPGMENGKAVPVRVTLEVTFKLL